MSLLVLLVGLACIPVELPPESWRAEGCTASSPDPDDRHPDRQDEVWLLLDAEERMRVHARWPRRADCVGAVVLVPPGFEAGERLLDKGQADALSERGVAVLSFDPRGRGHSDGVDDINGYQGQDDLAALLRWLSARTEVDPTHIVVSSRSFGGALAAGALGRHEDLAPAGWVDVESPGDLSEDLAWAPELNQERFAEVVDPQDPEAWWAEREPAGLIGTVTSRYHRIQGIPDHALGERTLHAVAMLSGAVMAEETVYNGIPMAPEEATPEFVRDNAITSGEVVDPDDWIVTEAVLDYLW